MRKQHIGRTLSLKKDQRNALLTSLTRELFKQGKIETTRAKAKELSRKADSLITKLKAENLPSRRELFFLNSREVKTFMEQHISKMKNRPGGYTRVIRLTPRKSDGAQMSIVEFVL